MGGCCSTSEGEGIKLVGYTSGAKPALTEGLGGPKRHILRVKAHVMVLSFDESIEGELGQWRPWMKESGFVYLYCVKESETSYVYQVTSSGLEGKDFSSFIEVPRTRLRKLSANFVFWKDEGQESVWGLNFSSERDTLRFLAGCTPLSSGIKTNYGTISSTTALSLPVAPPPLPDYTSLQLSGEVPDGPPSLTFDRIGSYQQNGYLSTSEHMNRTTPITVGTIPITVRATPITVGATPITVGATPITVGATPITVRATPITVRATPITVGATPITVGATPITVGATPITVGATPITGGTAPITSGSTPITSGATPITVGTTPITSGGSAYNSTHSSQWVTSTSPGLTNGTNMPTETTPTRTTPTRTTPTGIMPNEATHTEPPHTPIAHNGTTPTPTTPTDGMYSVDLHQAVYTSVDNDTSCSEPPGNHFQLDVSHIDDVIEGKSLSSMDSSEEDNMVTNIDDLSGGEELEEPITHTQEGEVPQWTPTHTQEGEVPQWTPTHTMEGEVPQWTTVDTNASFLSNFALHDIPEAEEEIEEGSTGDGVSSPSSPRPSQLSLSAPQSSTSLNPPQLPLSPAPGELMSPTARSSGLSSPRFTTLFDTFSGVESPMRQFDQILRELSKSISLDRIVSDSYLPTSSPPVSQGEDSSSTSSRDFTTAVNELRGNSVPTHTSNVSQTGSVSSHTSSDLHPHLQHLNEESSTNLPHRQRHWSEDSSSPLKVSASLDYLSEVQEYMENFSKEMDVSGIPLSGSSIVDQTPSAGLVVVKLPSEQVIVIHVDSATTVGDVLMEACEPYHYVPEEHFAVFIEEEDNKRQRTLVPEEHEKVFYLDFTRVEIWEKEIVSVHLVQLGHSREGFGLELDPTYGDEDREVLLSATVRGVAPGSPAHLEGVVVGDEVIMVNDVPLFEVSWTGLQELLRSTNVSMTLRSRKAALKQLKSRRGSIYRCRPRSQDFLKDMSEDVLMAFLEPKGEEPAEEEVSATSLSPQKMKAIGKIEKTIGDLVQTERDSLKHLESILQIYYQPLQRAGAANDDVNAIFGGIAGVMDFQRKLLQDLENVLESVHSPEFSQRPLKKSEHLIEGITSVFHRHGDKFKLYSMFCTSHCRLQNIISTDSGVVKSILVSCVPPNQLNLQLETVFTKPIQRVLQYPLYLHVLEKQVPQNSHERRQLDGVISRMDVVVNYINEMQRVSDNFTAVFDSMLKDVGQWKLSQSVSVQCLRFRGVFAWLNPAEEVGKGWKKGQGPDIECFVFRALVLLFIVEKKKRRTSRTSLNSVTQSNAVSLDEVKYRTVLLCSTCVARDLPDSDGVTNMWQLFSAHMGSIKACTFILRCRSKEQKLQALQLFR